MARKSIVANRVYVRGDCRIIVNREQGYVCQMTPDTCTITKFQDLKRLTPNMIEYAAAAWGFTLQAEPKRKAA